MGIYNNYAQMNIVSAIAAFRTVNTESGRFVWINRGKIVATDNANISSSIREIDRYVRENFLFHDKSSVKEYILLQELNKYYDRQITHYAGLSNRYKGILSRALAYCSPSYKSESLEASELHAWLLSASQQLKERTVSLSKSLTFNLPINQGHQKKTNRHRKKALELNMQLSQANLQSSDVFKSSTNSLPIQMFNFGLKDANKHIQLQKLNAQYQGQSCHDIGEKRTEHALQLLNQIVFEGDYSSGIQSDEDIKCLSRIVQNRVNHYAYSQSINKSFLAGQVAPALLKEIQENVELLDDAKSIKVLAIKSGTTSFSIPGGWTNHYISYEFRKEGNDYYFVIHNRGDHSNDARIHGKLAFKEESTGKTFGKTIVKIKTNKEALKDETFLEKIILAQFGIRGDNNKKVYDIIHDYFISSKKGTIVKNNVELELEKLFRLLPKCVGQAKETILSKAMELIEKDESFQSHQLYGTCSESNFATLENQLASPLVLKVLERFTLGRMQDQLNKRVQAGEYADEMQSIDILKEHVKRRVDELDGELLLLRSCEVNALNSLALKSKQPITQIEKAEFIKCIKEGRLNLQNVPQELRDDRDVVLAAIEKNGLDLQYAAKKFQNDPTIVLVAVKQNGLALEFASEELRNKNEIVIPALCKTLHAFQHVSNRIKNDKEFIDGAMMGLGATVLNYASKEIRNNKDFMLQCVKKKGLVVMYASDELKKDKEIAAASIISTNGIAIAFLPKEWMSDADFILSLFKQESKLGEFVLNKVSSELFSDRNFMRRLVKIKGITLKYASEELRRDKKIVRAAIKQDPQALRYAPKSLRGDSKVVMQVLKRDGTVLEHVSNRFKDDRAFVSVAANQNKAALVHASNRLRSCPELA